MLFYAGYRWKNINGSPETATWIYESANFFSINTYIGHSSGRWPENLMIYVRFYGEKT